MQAVLWKSRPNCRKKNSRSLSSKRKSQHATDFAAKLSSFRIAQRIIGNTRRKCCYSFGISVMLPGECAMLAEIRCYDGII
jgi:hypothetical protein